MAAAPIELICGCMFSGKTTELIRRIRACRAGQRVVTLKPAIDDRYSPTDIVTHDRHAITARVVRSAGEVESAIGQADVVAIDEVHFFGEDFVDLCVALAARGVRVLCTGLDRDMWGDPFPHVQRLAAIADTTVLYGVCACCGRRADRTQRTVPLVDLNLVGGSEAFEPRCQACFSPPDAPKPGRSIPGLVDPAT